MDQTSSTETKVRNTCHIEKPVNSFLKKYCRITPKEYNHILNEQDGSCKICGTTTPGGNRKFFCVDHDHNTGKVRGLLCSHCNTGLGHFYDNTALLTNAIEYLKKASV